MCYISNQDICLLSDDKAHGERGGASGYYFLGVSSFYFITIGGGERGESTGAGAENRSI